LLHPPESSEGYFSSSFEADFRCPLTSAVAAFPGRHAAQHESEGDILEHGQVRHERVLLIHHAAFGAGPLDGLAKDLCLTACGRMVWPQTGDDPQHGGLAATGRTDHRH